MAVIKFVKVSKGNLKNAIKYITRQDKTNEDLIYCKDCDFNNCIEQFNYFKKFYNKTDGRQYYHFIQSFSPEDKLSYDLANKIGQEMCKHFDDYQIVMSTHIDKEYIHNHFIMNSVNFKNGSMYHQNEKELIKIKKISNELCSKYGLKQINLNNNKYSKYLKSGEYHLSKKEQTIKYKLIKDINKCIKMSKSREHFIFNMCNLGYKVKWQDNRKYITYTTPENMKFRDKRLGNEKYSKERMSIYFERISNVEKIKKVISNTSPLKHKNNSNIKNINIEELSDVAKKDYLKKIENASSIEWE